MASHDYVVSNDTGANVRADINTALSAIVTQNSVSGTPASTFAHMIWADTSVTGSLFKVRNAANGASASLFTATGLIKPADGGLTDVAVGPSSDIDTGFHFATAATITMVTAGTARCTLSATATTFNASAADVDFIVGATGGGANSLFVQGSDGAIGIRTGAPAFAIHATYDASAFWAISRASADTGCVGIISRKSRGTHASPGATSSGDTCFQVLTQAYHATGTAGFATTGAIEMLTDGAESGDTVPTAFRVRTMASGGALTERMRITSDGLVGINTTPTVGAGAGQLHVANSTTTQFDITATHASATASATFCGRKSRGTLTSPTDVAIGDLTSAMYSYGYLNSGFRYSGHNAFIIDATPSGSILQSRWNVYTTDTGGLFKLACADGGYVALTDNSATTVFSLINASNTIAGCVIDYVVHVFDGTDLQIENGRVRISVINKAGAWTVRQTEENVTQDLGAGTLTTTWAVSSASPAVVSLNANTSLSPSATYPRLYYSITNLSDQSVTF